MMTYGKNNWVVLAFVFGVTLVLGFRIWNLVDQFAPVIYVMDRWHTLEPLFQNMSIWEGFSFQHGGHRLGLIYFLFRFDASISDWNGRVDMFTQALLFIVTASLAVWLKYRLFKTLKWTDALIPLIFITPQVGTGLVINPFVHGLVPFFAVLIGLTYTVKHSELRITLLVVFSTIAAFSGFAVVVSISVLLLELIRFIANSELRKQAIILMVSVGFTIGYIIISNRVNETFNTGFSDMLNTVSHGLLLVANLFVVEPTGRGMFIGAGLLVVLFSLAAVFMKNGKLYASNSNFASLFVLVFSVLVFVVLNVIGRSQLSLGNSVASRYVPVAMCLVFSLYILILMADKNIVRIPLLLAIGVLLIQSQAQTQHVEKVLETRLTGVDEWEACLKETADYGICEELVSNKKALHPNPKKVDLQGKLNFLKENELNIFRP